MTDPKNIKPTVDAGTDTLARFRYQAELIFPFCVMCAVGEEISSVIPEHLEDVAIESASGWRFIQVKSRDPERGPWSLSDLLGKGGALRSLHRTYLQIEGLDASLEILVEGALKRQDSIANLCADGNRTDTELVKRVATGLQIEDPAAGKFLSRVSLSNSPPPRAFAKTANLILLHQQNPTLDHTTVISLHDKVVAEIDRAMRADRLGETFPKYVTHPNQCTGAVADLIAAKQLTSERLRELLPALEECPKTLLSRAVAAASPPMTMLERKLIAGGATAAIVDLARNLRANSQAHWLRLKAASRYPANPRLEDLHLRLETHVNTLLTTCETDSRPAVKMWTKMLDQFTQSPSSIDFNSVMNHDPMLLMGEVGTLAEDCVIDFGFAK